MNRSKFGTALTTLALALVVVFSAACCDKGKSESGAAGSSSASQGGKFVRAVIKTNMGDIQCELFPDKAPETVANFAGLATGSKQWTDPRSGQPVNRPLYNGTIFHRIIAGFMIQGGDPLGNGRGGPGYRFKDEFDPSLRFDRPYLLAMANAGPGTNGSQFFITVGPTPHLTNRHTIFGDCSASGELVEKISKVQTGPGDRPVQDVVIQEIVVQD